MVTSGEFLAAMARFERLAPNDELRRWLELAHGLAQWKRDQLVFLVTEITGAEGEGKLERVKWCVAAELLAPADLAEARAAIPERVRPFADALKRSCARCDAPGVLVAHEYSDDGYDPTWYCETFSLCTAAPHVSSIARTPGGFLTAAD